MHRAYRRSTVYMRKSVSLQGGAKKLATTAISSQKVPPNISQGSVVIHVYVVKSLIKIYYKLLPRLKLKGA